jgi:hypothetical protein
MKNRPFRYVFGRMRISTSFTKDLVKRVFGYVGIVIKQTLASG